MAGGGDLTAVVPLALGAAACYGVASVLQHQATSAQPPELAMRAGLVMRLVKNPRWLLGNVLDVVGFGLQLVALRYGPITLVEPLLVTSLVFAFPVAAVVRRRPVPRGEAAAAALVACGLALFLAVARPGTGRAHVGGPALVALAAVSAVVVAALAIVPRRAAQQWAGLFMAAAAGVTYGYMSAATSLSWRIVHHGVLHALASWGPYAVVVSGLVGMVCTQSAFSAGMLRLSLPTMTVVQPLVAVAIGLTVLTEPVGRAGLDPLWEALGLAATVVGVYALAQPEFGD